MGGCYSFTGYFIRSNAILQIKIKTMPSNDVTDKSLSELKDIVSGDSPGSEEVVQNAKYELEFRQEMIEVMARGGTRPTHQPPNP